jgi:hypothetical protein
LKQEIPGLDPGAEVAQPTIRRAQAADKALSCAPRRASPGCGAKRGRWPKHMICSRPFYGWFTEGFDTANLKEAKALLDQLA